MTKQIENVTIAISALAIFIYKAGAKIITMEFGILCRASWKEEGMKKFLSVLFVLLVALLSFSFAAFAAEGEEITYPTEGYVYNTEGKETNIKWTVTVEEEQNVCRFEIDPGATDKVQATVVTACDAEGNVAGWSTNNTVPWYYYGKINKMVFGPGITGATGGVYMVISTIRVIEVSPDFKTTGYATFEVNAGLNTFHVTGTEFKNGHGDFSKMTSIGSYCFDGAKFESIDISGSLTGLPAEAFKGNKLRELVIPENIKNISDGAFKSNVSLKKVTVESKDCKFAANTFDGCVQLFTFVGYKGSTAETFAKDGGYQFVDIETGEVVIEGTRIIEKDPAEIIAQYPREEADDSGHIVDEYQGYKVVDTYWAYFKDSKTLVFYNNTTGYNETGNGNSNSDSPTRYTAYKFEAEHIIMSSGIHKVSNGAFEGFKALKTVGIGVNMEQIDPRAFHNCTSLRSVYKMGKDPVDGVADLSMIGAYKASVLKNTAIETVQINAKAKADAINAIAFIGCKNLVATVDDNMIKFAKANFMNLINIEDENDKYEFYQYINPDTATAGSSSIASFDEATGTLTLLGTGETFDIVNYYGGGSKTQPWFKYKQDIKKIVVGPDITYIGKYAFCQCKNLEEVVLPDTEITIGAGAFEKCYNLKSVHTSSGESVMGTFDLRTVSVLEPYIFAYNYYLVNPIISDKTDNIKSASFEDCMNIKTVYGSAGTYAESFASENGYTFSDISAGYPAAMLATPPEMNQDEKEEAERESQYGDDTEAVETVDLICHFIIEEPGAVTSTDKVSESEDNGSMTVIIIAAVAAAVVIGAASAIVIIKKKAKKA